MADGKTITVRIAAVGGDQAAAEVRKVESALGLVIETEEDLARKRAGFLSAAEAEVAEVERLVRAAQKESAATKQNTASTEESTAATKRAKTAKDQLADSSRKVTASAVSMRTGIQNAAFQFQDMAVQAEMGVSATRIFSQQVPQLLGGFGAIGAVAGAALGIGVPLAAALFSSGKEAEDAKPKIDDINDALENFAESAEKAADAKRADVNEEWLQSLDAEEKSYERINQRLAIQIALNAKLRAIKEGGDAAEREARIAEIEADPNKSEEQKISETAAVREEASRARAAAEKQKLDDQAKLDAAEAADKQATAQRQAADAETAAQARAALEAQRKAIEDQANTGKDAQARLPGLEKDLSGAQRSIAFSINPETGAPLPGYEELSAEIERLKAEIADAKNAANRLPELDAARKISDSNLEQFRGGETKQKQQAEAAKAEAEKAADQALASGVLAREAGPGIDRQLTQDLRGQAARRDSALRAVADRKKSEDDDKNRRKDQEEERNIQRDAKGIPGQVEEGISGARGTRVTREVEAAAAKLKDGASADEYSGLGAALESFVSASQSLSAGRKQELNNLKKTIDNLAARLRIVEGK